MTEPAATLECPATPERIDQCPATPEGRASSGSGDQRADSPATNDSSDRTGANSPPPNCAICLGRCINKCFTDNCVHHFCFNCLLEWSKIKPECPLCKQTFKSIIHNVRSPSQYEEYIVTPRPHSQPLLHRLNVFLSERPRFRYRATLQVRPHESEAIQQLLFQQASPDHVFYDGWIQPNNRSNQNRFRRHVYDLNLYALPLSDITGRQRDCSALFYRENPAQIHRLMPWLSREIHVLSNNVGHRTEFITTLIQNMLEEYDISSLNFLESLEPHLVSRTRHFIHEFLVFARSPYDMYGYDRNVRYGEPGDIPHFLESNIDPVVISTEEEISDDDEDDDDVRLITRGGSARTEFTIETRSNMSTVIVMGSLGRSNYSNDVSVPRDDRNNGGDPDIGTSTTASGSSSNGPLNYSVGPTTQTENGASGSQTTTVVESLLTDSDSDDCLFVREQKPPHLRTPELVVLNSEDEDSDVVFIDENERNEVDKKINVPPKKRARMDESNDNASESEEIDSKYIPKIEMEIPPQIEAQPTVLAYSTSQPSTSTAAVNKNVSDCYFQPIKKPKHFKFSSCSSDEDEIPINAENGPSTSIETSKTDTKRKAYFKPIRKHRVNPKNKNKIFDSTSSSSGSSDEEATNDRNENDEIVNDQVPNEMEKAGPSATCTSSNSHNISKYVKYHPPSSSSDSSSSSSHEEYRIYNASKRKKQKLTPAKRNSSRKSTSGSRSKGRGRSSGSKSVTSALIKKSIKNKKKSNKRSRKSKSYVIKINSSDASDSSSNSSSQSGKSRGGGGGAATGCGGGDESSLDTGENHRTKKIQKIKLRLKRRHDTTSTDSE